MTKPETLDCVDVKRRAQRALARTLAGKSPDEQAQILQRLAAKTPLRRSLAKLGAKRGVRARGKRRSKG